MGIGVQRDADIRVPHDVLQSFWAHAAARHVGTEGVPAYMGCDLRKLYFINAVVLIQDILEVMLPMEGNHGHPVLVQKQEARIAVDDWLLLRRLSVGDHPAKAFHNLLAHGYIPLTTFGLGVLDDVLHITLALKLVIYPDTLVLEVDVRNGQPAKLGNPQPGIEQDVDSVIVFAVAVILLNELEECPLLRPGNGFSGHAVVDNHGSQLKAKGILADQVILHRHLKGRANHAPNRMDGTVASAILLQLNQPRLGIGQLYLVNAQASFFRMPTTKL